MVAMISQLSSSSAVNRSLKLQRFSFPSPSPRSKFTVFMRIEGRGTDTSSSESKARLSYTADASKSPEDGAGKSGRGEPVQENGGVQQKRAAKIHDFCFGIPYGETVLAPLLCTLICIKENCSRLTSANFLTTSGLVLSGGLLGFVLSRKPATLSSGVLFGGALLALSTFSLKIWRLRKSSVPFILGQHWALLWKNYQTYSLTKKAFPPGFYAAISAAMLCFYSYVLISGGNPPPKKLKPSPSVS